MRSVIEGFLFIPWILAVFPVPLLFPIAFTCTVIGDECPHSTKVIVLTIYYTWLALLPLVAVIGHFIKPVQHEKESTEKETRTWKVR
jgi:hypothetical protein